MRKLGIITFVFIMFFLVTIYLYIPFKSLYSLKSGYVSVDYKSDTVNYSIVSKRPKYWTPLSLISKDATHAIQISEDWSFFEHYGLDYKEIGKSIFRYITEDRPLRGASTISQQLVKNLFLTNERTLERKLKEMIITFSMEMILSKEKILETYLNIIEYGNGIYGIEAAGHHYFKVHPLMLSPKQGAFLAMLLPNPKLYSRSYEVKTVSPFAEGVIQSILYKMKVAKYIDDETMNRESAKPFKWEDVKGDLHL